MPRSIEETKKLFDTWAKTYDHDLKNVNGILEGYDTSIQTATDMCPVLGGMQVLDVGIGTGEFYQKLEAKGAIISGIDLSEAMLKECQKLPPTYQLRPGTFQTIPFSDNQFDVVVSSFCFHEVALSERRDAYNEVYRVLRVGGHLCLLDIMFASASAMEEARRHLKSQWDGSEEYAFVGDMSVNLYASGFHSVQWEQTGRLHWMCLEYK